MDRWTLAQPPDSRACLAQSSGMRTEAGLPCVHFPALHSSCSHGREAPPLVLGVVFCLPSHPPIAILGGGVFPMGNVL